MCICLLVIYNKTRAQEWEKSIKTSVFSFPLVQNWVSSIGFWKWGHWLLSCGQFLGSCQSFSFFTGPKLRTACPSFSSHKKILPPQALKIPPRPWSTASLSAAPHHWNICLTWSKMKPERKRICLVEADVRVGLLEMSSYKKNKKSLLPQPWDPSPALLFALLFSGRAWMWYF